MNKLLSTQNITIASAGIVFLFLAILFLYSRYSKAKVKTLPVNKKFKDSEKETASKKNVTLIGIFRQFIFNIPKNIKAIYLTIKCNVVKGFNYVISKINIRENTTYKVAFAASIVILSTVLYLRFA